MDGAAPPGPPRGRAASGNPANRFTHLSIESEEAPPEKVPTLYLRDTTRGIIARNDSPDVGFKTSVNPYRGCEHGCVYCLDGETPILMANGTTRPLHSLRAGDEIYGTRRDGWYRRYVRTRVLAHWETSRPAHAITLADGTRLIASGDHRFLTGRGWKFVTGTEQGPNRRPHLTLHNELLGTGRFAVGPDLADPAYRRGYLAGLIRGDGHLASHYYERAGRSHGDVHQFRLALVDEEALERARSYLADFDVSVDHMVFQEAVGDRRRMNGISTQARAKVERIRDLVRFPAGERAEAWRRGFLAGIYDAEGSYSCKTLRLSNTDAELVDAITASLRSFELGFAVEVRRPEDRRPVQVVRLTGGLAACLRFWHTVGNAISRKRDIEGRAIKSGVNLSVRSIEPLPGASRLFDITTGTGDFIANGVVSHNCFARPTHEYLGFSAGLDFETRILVKEDAPELLRAELASPRWTPQTIAMSGVTDCYQPIERKLELTRRCLAVLVELRNPVVIVTKNALVRRDGDLLADLARDRAAMVCLSITTLDGELAQRMEPRTSHPRRRLEAIADLTARGVPCAVLVSPVVPGLTDHEMPGILAAAREAGAVSARFLPLRLPGAVAELFQQWLAEHYPDRRDKVLNRIRSLRGGRLNDPRFGSRMQGEGIFAEQMRALFETSCRRLGFPEQGPELSTAAFRRPSEPGAQLDLFGSS
ncbi:MAG TPA: PA0069 family radical SAM protein [Thermoanaerobaculia bacterium]|nr:PA0069 family radical SAM protein [Thermoanaerobaculia bacterium]